MRFLLVVGLLAGSLCLAPGPKAEEQPDVLDTVQRIGADWVAEYVDEEVLQSFELPTESDVRRFMASLDSVLETGSLEDFAWIRPEVEHALTVLDAVEGAEPYADWLRQRIDYLDLADQVTRQVPVPGVLRPVRKRPPPSIPFQTLTRPRRKPAVSADVARRRTAAVSSLPVWEKRLSKRAAPERSKRLVPSLKKTFAAEGVPPELVWLAEVESSFNPEAVSPVGARGLFQFMPATAKRFGLRTNPVDERLNPRKSARAAARYLKTLHRQFGSWPLALAAYNAGEGRVGRALKKHRESSFSGVAPHLPLETRMYVPKVLATVRLREGVDPNRLPSPS